MKTILLLGCVKQKQTVPSQAKSLYRSPLWRGRRAYAEQSSCPGLILSALHGLVEPEQVLEPYDLALTDLPAAERRAWGARVIEKLEERFGRLGGVTLQVHAGAAYRRAIEEGLKKRGATMAVPLEELSLGRQLAWYRDR